MNTLRAYKKRSKRLVMQIIAYVLARVCYLLRLTCSFSVVNDPRPMLRRQDKNYVYALLHAHQLAAILSNDERALFAMVSRSQDGDLLVPALKIFGVKAVRGSNNKGGAIALLQLIQYVRQGKPALLAVDGPRGPRGSVQPGIVMLAQETGAVILPVAACSTRYWTLHKSWDQFQIPRPFSHIKLIFAAPIDTHHISQEALVVNIANTLHKLEATGV